MTEIVQIYLKPYTNDLVIELDMYNDASAGRVEKLLQSKYC